MREQPGSAGELVTVPFCSRAENWRWSSLWRREHEQTGGTLSSWPVPPPTDWLSRVNRAQSPREEEALRECIAKGRPYGSEDFQSWTAEMLQLASSFRDRGQPAKEGSKV